MNIVVPDNTSPAQALRIVADALEGRQSGVASSWAPDSTFPKLMLVAGVAMMLAAPINPNYLPSTSAQLLGTQGSYVKDPAIPAGARSPAGYPMVDGRVSYGDSTYANDAEVEAVRARDAAAAGINEELARQQASLQPSAQDVRNMSGPELDWVLANIAACLKNGGTTHGPVSALHVLSAFMSRSGIADAGYMATGTPNGFVVPPAGFPQLASMTVARAKELLEQAGRG